MISFRYLLPVSLPFFLALAAIAVFVSAKNERLRPLCLFLILAFSASIYDTKHDGGSASIPGNGTEAWKEALDYITRDAAAHPETKSAMLNNLPAISAYYGYKEMPKWE